MATLEAVCRTQSTLSPVQIHILQNSEELLQFASDLSHRELFVYVPGKDAGTLVLAAHRTPRGGGRRQSGKRRFRLAAA